MRAPRDEAESLVSKGIVVDMLQHMKRHPSQGGPEVIAMPRFRDERTN